ncbi:tyrosine-protein phosphatase [Oceanicella sp. SM1341]|uniref:tyrosine-protein phosphatase n=1 Tax=Oceanicella sp. SM1341 TaxID=1548889 RepID=UPI0013008DB9|nr:tyrosine-protein phosphatase [Oceanicella sp. SM1341]
MNPFSKSPEARARRRQRDLQRWSEPPTSWWGRFRAWSNMLLQDHGVFRLIYPNYHRLGKTGARSAQPSPGLLARFAREGGRTVISLRGGMLFGSLPLEILACEKLGLTFTRVRVRSRELPSREEFRELVRTMREAEAPVLYHCKSGADRAGFVSVLHMHLIEGQPLEQALGQLSARYGHFKHAKTGILDRFYETCLAETAESGMGLEEWVETRYDPAAIKAGFRSTGPMSWVVEKILRRE